MANFAILRVAKLKNLGALAVSGQHNFRERETKNANGERLHLNQIEGAHSTAELVKSVSNLLPAKRRKDAVIGLEYLITASPEVFGADWMETKNHGQDYFKDAVAWLEKLHGKENVVCKTVHLDESTPHMAVYVVPLKDGKLNAKAFTGGRKVLADMQTSFAVEVGAKHGLERGVERSRAIHQDNAKIQPMTIERMNLRKQVQALEAEVERLTKRVGGDGEALAATQERLKYLNETMLNDFQELKALKKENASMKVEIKRATDSEKALVAEVADLTKENEEMKKTLVTATERDHQLVAEISALRAENKNAQATIEQLQAIDRVLVDRTRERMAQEVAQKAPERAREAYTSPAVMKSAEEALAALMDIWQAKPAQQGYGTVKAIEGPYVVQHIGRGVNVCLTLENGVKAPPVGSKATIKDGQVVSAKVQERGGLSR